MGHDLHPFMSSVIPNSKRPAQSTSLELKLDIAYWSMIKIWFDYQSLCLKSHKRLLDEINSAIYSHVDLKRLLGTRMPYGANADFANERCTKLSILYFVQ
jgi:hypothetical protein